MCCGYLSLTTLLLFLSSLSLSASDGTTELRLQVDGLRSQEGVLRILIFQQAEGFPSDPAQAYRQITVPIEAGQTEVVVEGLIPGTYAVSLHHDEDNDAELDKSALGFPREGIGTSNDAIRKFGPPRFEEASISLPEQGKSILVEMRYWKS